MRRENRTYYFSVEGDTEQWYLEWLQRTINAEPTARYTVKLDCKIQKDPVSRVKRMTVVGKTEITHIFDYESNEVGRYKTCYQISEILSIFINGLIPTCKAKVIERTIPGRRFNNEHVATEVEFDDGLKIILDLTLDLANIQGGMKTKEFGYSSNSENEYDIISLRECAQIDKKLGFITEKYTDDYIDEFVNSLDNAEFKNKTPIEQLNYKILKTKELFGKDFKGAHEATRYIYILLNKVLSPKEFSCLKQYNLSYKNSNELNLMAIYAFDDYGLYYSFSNELGFTKVSPTIISNLLKNGWKTNSKSIQEIFDKPEQDKINRQK